MCMYVWRWAGESFSFEREVLTGEKNEGRKYDVYKPNRPTTIGLSLSLSLSIYIHTKQFSLISCGLKCPALAAYNMYKESEMKDFSSETTGN